MRVVAGCLLACGLLGVVALGCGGVRTHEVPGASARVEGADKAEEAAERVVALAPYLDRVQGQCDTGGSMSRFVAYVEADDIRYLIERTGPSVTSAVWVNEYFFERGRLFLFRGHWRAEAGAPGPGGGAAGELRLAFDDSGLLVSASKTVDGFPGVLDEGEVSDVRRRVGHLRMAALEAYWRQRVGVRR